MDPTLAKAFLVLFVGMFTVIVILTLVVLSGKVLILIINKYFPLPEKKIKSESASGLTETKMPQGMNPKQLAAIVAAVEVVTGGKGKLTSVKRKKQGYLQ